tara:strand:- start:3131 stop:3661 length:531 start_codon:yes stop_codon:yes gene_type:complete
MVINMKKAVIFDIDDLLFTTKVRRKVYDYDKEKYDTSTVKANYEVGEYFIYDSPLPFAIDIPNAFKDAGYELIYITGRRKSMLGATFEQFNLYEIPYTKKLVFHKDTKQQNTTQYKSEVYDSLTNQGYDIQFFFDDDDGNCDMAQFKGIKNIYQILSDFVEEVYTDKIKTDLNWFF